MGRPAAIEVSRLKWSGGTLSAGHRTVPEEVPADPVNAMAALQKRQVLNAQARAVHAAGLWLGQDDLLVREDVARHNALDKIIGAAAVGHFRKRWRCSFDEQGLGRTRSENGPAWRIDYRRDLRSDSLGGESGR